MKFSFCDASLEIVAREKTNERKVCNLVSSEARFSVLLLKMDNRKALFRLYFEWHLILREDGARQDGVGQWAFWVDSVRSAEA